MKHPVRAIVVDDSHTARTLIAEILAADPQIDVVGRAANGVEALDLIHRLRPSVVVMDIEMPVLNGFETTKRIMTERPTPVVIVTSHHDPKNVALCLHATRLGALTVQPKPSTPDSPTFERDSFRFVSLVKALADVHVVRRRPSASPGRSDVRASTSGPSISASQHSIDVIGVGASTGGPAALFRLLAALPEDLNVPVLVVQHIAPGFTGGLARWLATATSLPVQVADDGERARRGTVYVGRDGAHLLLGGDGRLRLVATPPVGGFRPSVSSLFASLAERRGVSAAGVVLTGMGMDGLEGARAIRAAGGVVLAQDEESSAVFGMPRAVVDAGLADFIGPVEALALKLLELTSDGNR